MSPFPLSRRGLRPSAPASAATRTAVNVPAVSALSANWYESAPYYSTLDSSDPDLTIMPFDGGFSGGGSQITALQDFNAQLVSTFGWSSAQAYAHGTAGAPASGGAGPVKSGMSGKCLDDYADSAANGTKADLYDCNGTAAHNWNLP